MSETLDWARTLVVLGVESIDAEQAKTTLHVLLKYRTDIERAAKELLSTWADRAEAVVLDVLTGFVGELRRAGLPVSLTEPIDAAEAVHHIPLEDRDALKYALAATLVKSSTHWKAFETAFEVYFSMRGPQYDIDDELSAGDLGPTARRRTGAGGRARAKAAGAARSMTPEELAEMLYRALLSADDALVRRWPARPSAVSPAWSRGARWAAPTTSTARCGTSSSTGSSSGSWRRPSRPRPAGRGAHPARGAPGRRRVQGRASTGSAREVEDEIRRRLVADRGVEALARSVRKPLPEDIDVMHATRDELASLRRALHPLSRKLAVRLARKRRHGRRGPLDFRATMRHSLSTGGVPVDPKFRYPRPAKPEIIVIADISGSVASFARFTLHLVHAISSQFSKVRSFVFIDGIDEVTRFFEDRRRGRRRAPHQHRGRRGVGGRALRLRPRAVGVLGALGRGDHAHRASVLLLGDARNNYHASQAWVVEEIRQARHVYWLNPEPRATGARVIPSWGSTRCTATTCSSAGTCASSSTS